MSNVKAYLEDIVRDGLHDIAEALKGGGPAGDVQASHVIYDNETSGLLGTNAQEAIDELSTKVNTNASGISDLTTRMGTAEGDITALEAWKNNLDASDIPYGSGTVEDALDSSAPKTDIATVETGSTASRAYSVGELVYVNGNLYKVITTIASGATFTVGTNIQSTNVSGSVKDALDTMPKKIGYVNVDISGIAINLTDSRWYYALVTIPNIPTGATCFSVALGNFDANVIVNVGTGNRIVLQSPVSKTLPSPRNVRVFYYL